VQCKRRQWDFLVCLSWSVSCPEPPIRAPHQSTTAELSLHPDHAVAEKQEEGGRPHALYTRPTTTHPADSTSCCTRRDTGAPRCRDACICALSTRQTCARQTCQDGNLAVKATDRFRLRYYGYCGIRCDCGGRPRHGSAAWRRRCRHGSRQAEVAEGSFAGQG
jgi:hypothetical protein